MHHTLVASYYSQGLKSELEAARRERDELSSKLGALRSEVKATIDQVTADRWGCLIVHACMCVKLRVTQWQLVMELGASRAEGWGICIVYTQF